MPKQTVPNDAQDYRATLLEDADRRYPPSPQAGPINKAHAGAFRARVELQEGINKIEWPKLDKGYGYNYIKVEKILLKLNAAMGGNWCFFQGHDFGRVYCLDQKHYCELHIDNELIYQPQEDDGYRWFHRFTHPVLIDVELDHGDDSDLEEQLDRDGSPVLNQDGTPVMRKKKKKKKNTSFPQDMGTYITFYRRYSIVTLFALPTEDDNDAAPPRYERGGGGGYRRENAAPSGPAPAPAQPSGRKLS